MLVCRKDDLIESQGGELQMDGFTTKYELADDPSYYAIKFVGMVSILQLECEEH